MNQRPGKPQGPGALAFSMQLERQKAQKKQAPIQTPPPSGTFS
jgi:hypothetical protein